MEHILLPLIERLSAGMPALSLVDEDYGQLEALDEADRDTYPLTYPAVLIDLEGVDWEQLEGDTQFGTLRLRARLILDCYDDTHSTSGTLARITERAALRAEMHALLEGFRVTPEASGLVRTESRFWTQRHGIKVYQESYSARVMERLPRQRVRPRTPPRLALLTTAPASDGGSPRTPSGRAVPPDRPPHG